MAPLEECAFTWVALTHCISALYEVGEESLGGTKPTEQALISRVGTNSLGVRITFRTLLNRRALLKNGEHGLRV